jgi:Ser/Thr protein kinase RdoA (MazF antagonist)
MLDPQNRNPISAAAAVRIARDFFSLAAEAVRLDGEYDDNFRLRAADGREFVLKVMHPAREREFVAMQVAVLQRIAERTPDLSSSRVVSTSTGENFCVARDDAGTARLVWLLEFVPGRPFAHFRPHTPELAAQLGHWLGRLARALDGFDTPAAHRRVFKWDLAQATWIAERLDALDSAARRDLVTPWLELYESTVRPKLAALPQGVIHGDANDHNVLVSAQRGGDPFIAGVIDFGDMHFTARVCEPAIAAAYALLDRPDPLPIVCALIAGYDRATRLDDAELEVLFPLIAMRLCVSVVNSAIRKREAPDDPYVTISEAPAWRALEKFAAIHPREAHYALRSTCGRRRSFRMSRRCAITSRRKLPHS